MEGEQRVRIAIGGNEVRVDDEDAVWLSQALWMAQGPGRGAAIALARRIAEALVAVDDATVPTDAGEAAQVKAILARAAGATPAGLSAVADAIARGQSA